MLGIRAAGTGRHLDAVADRCFLDGLEDIGCCVVAVLSVRIAPNLVDVCQLSRGSRNRGMSCADAIVAFAMLKRECTVRKSR